MAYFRAFVLPLANCELQLTVIFPFSSSPVDALPLWGDARFAGPGPGLGPFPDPTPRVLSEWGVAPRGGAFVLCFSKSQ